MPPIFKMEKIEQFNQINFKSNPEGRLLFIAITLLTVNGYSNNTPNEIIEVLNEKADHLLPENELTQENE